MWHKTICKGASWWNYRYLRGTRCLSGIMHISEVGKIMYWIRRNSHIYIYICIVYIYLWTGNTTRTRELFNAFLWHIDLHFYNCIRREQSVRSSDRLRIHTRGRYFIISHPKKLLTRIYIFVNFSYPIYCRVHVISYVRPTKLNPKRSRPSVWIRYGFEIN